LCLYWFEDAGKTASVSAARHRDVIKTLDDFHDDLSESLSEGKLRMA